jgi:hypothetical protein
MPAHGRGVRALQSERYIGFASHQTAWLMCHKIRTDLQDTDIRESISVAEADTLPIGSTAKNQQAGLARRGNFLLSALPHTTHFGALWAWRDTRGQR